MYRRPKFLEMLHEIREEMSSEADYDVDLFAENVRSGKGSKYNLNDPKIVNSSASDEPIITGKVWKSPLKQ
jgi:hypothetical protein